MQPPEDEAEDAYDGEEQAEGEEAEDAPVAEENGPYLIYDETGARTLHTIAYLRQHSLGDLMLKRRIKVSRHEDFPNVVQLRYSQINSSMSSYIVRECRGLILDESKNWAVIALPYEKFFNNHERHAARLDWATSRVYEKLDGSLATLYFYADKWHVASTTLPDGSGRFGNANRSTFSELFWKIWKELGYQLPPKRAQGKCFMFEMVSPENVILVPYTTNRLVLHGARDCATLREEAPEEYAAMGWQLAKQHPYRTEAEVVAAAARLSPTQCEGFVCVDAQYNRVKIKSPSYVALAHITPRNSDKANANYFLRIVLANESDEFLAYFPQHRWQFTDAKRRLLQLCADLAHLMTVAQHKSKTNPEKLRLVTLMKEARVRADPADVREFLAGRTVEEIEPLLAPLQPQIQGSSKQRGKGRP